MQHAFTPNVIFGMSPMWVSTILLVCVYAAIIWDKVNRAIIALLGIALMIFSGMLTQEEAMRGVDVNTASAFTGASPSEAIAGVGPGCENCASTRLPAAARTTAGKSCLMKTGDVPAT